MNLSDFENNLKTLDSLIPVSVESKQTIELKMGVWNGETMSSIEYIPNDAPDSYKIFKRLHLSFLNRRAILESLYYSAGGINTQKYLDAMREIEINVTALRKHYSYKSCSLLLVNQEDDPKVQVKLFSDYYLCGAYLKQRFGITVEDVISNTLPQHLNATRVFDQEWHTSEEHLISNYPTPDNTVAKPPNTNTAI